MDSAVQMYAAKLVTSERAVLSIATGETLCCGAALSQPPALLEATADRIRAGRLGPIRLYYKLALPQLATSLLADDVIESVEPYSFFITDQDRHLLAHHTESGLRRVNYVPSHFSQIPRIFEEDIELDTFMVTVAPMDAGGYFSLGTNNDFALSAAHGAKRILLEVNENMPRVFGRSGIHISEVSAVVENHVPLVEGGACEPSPAVRAIGDLIAPMVPHGATLQIGVGRVAYGVASALAHHSDLGIHTELFSPALADLINKGVITGARKTLHPRKHVFTMAIGTRDTYELMNNNVAFESHPASYVNDIRIIAANDNLVSINTALQVDLYGQVNAEAVGDDQFSGSGGHYDFVKGASLSRGGKSIIALQSTTGHGTLSAIVPRVPIVTDTRMDVDWVVTEYGAVKLRGKSTRQRAEALVSIAHPDFRTNLTAVIRGSVRI